MLTVSCEQRILPGAGNGSSTGVLIVLVHQATPTDKHESSNLLNTTTHGTHPIERDGRETADSVFVYHLPVSLTT